MGRFATRRGFGTQQNIVNRTRSRFRWSCSQRGRLGAEIVARGAARAGHRGGSNYRAPLPTVINRYDSEDLCSACVRSSSFVSPVADHCLSFDRLKNRCPIVRDNVRFHPRNNIVLPLNAQSLELPAITRSNVN